MTEFITPGYKTTQPETLASRDVPRLQFHGDRERLFNELHTRPFPMLEQGSRVSQLAVLHSGADASAEYRHIQTLCERYSVLPPFFVFPFFFLF